MPVQNTTIEKIKVNYSCSIEESKTFAKIVEIARSNIANIGIMPLGGITPHGGELLDNLGELFRKPINILNAIDLLEAEGFAVPDRADVPFPDGFTLIDNDIASFSSLLDLANNSQVSEIPSVEKMDEKEFELFKWFFFEHEKIVKKIAAMKDI